MENLPTVTQEVPADYTLTKRGQKMLVDPYNYNYCKLKEKNGRTFWTCPRRKSKIHPFCPGSAVTVGDCIKSTKRHNHPSDPVEIQSAKAVCKVLEMARENPSLKTSSLINSWSKETMHPAIRSKSTSLKVMERKIQRHKAKVQLHPGIPHSFADLETIPEKYTKTFDNERYLLANLTLETGERVLIYSSFFGLDMLKRSQVWSQDGTFGLCPSPFFQLYTCMAELDGHSYPALHAFLPNKRSATYKALFTEMKQHLPEVNLKQLLIDFEASVHKEFRAVFGKIDVTGCFFHLKKNLWKKLGQVAHLQSLYCSDMDFNVFINSIAGLAFVPPDLVPVYYDDLVSLELPKVMAGIKSNDQFDEEAKDDIQKSIEFYLEYCEKTYIGMKGRTSWIKPRFSISLWNQHENALNLKQRTTNRNEVFHSVMRKAIPSNASFWTCVDALVDYEAKTRVLRNEHRAKFSTSLETSPSNSRERRKSDNDLALKCLIEHREEYKPVEYLQRVANLQKLE